MMTLREYIAASGVKQAELAGVLGISKGHMSQLVTGAKDPSLQLAFAIEAATSGAVPASSWVKSPNGLKQKDVA